MYKIKSHQTGHFEQYFVLITPQSRQKTAQNTPIEAKKAPKQA
jgi:hypothetical protein